jgi:hypothetical protein
MSPAENLAARARLARHAAARARTEGDENLARVQDRVLSRVCGEAERTAAGTEGSNG